MRRITAYLAIALSTFILGTSITRAWKLFVKAPGFDSSSSGLERDLRVTAAIPTSEVEEELFEIARQYDIAQTNQDAAFFEKLETDNFILTYADGSTLTKAQDIALMKSWDPKTKFVSDDLHVQVYGNAAILSGRIIEIGPTGSRDSWRWVDLFVKRDERWQILSTTQVGW
jgi:hypothetical protein